MSKRKKKKKGKREKFKGIDLNHIKVKLTSLQQGKRFREAIIYAYYNYLLLVQGFYNTPRHSSKTAREYAMDMVKKVKIPPTIIYPFTTLYEIARFGREPMNMEQYNEAFKLFMSLHDRIMGGPAKVGTEGASAA